MIEISSVQGNKHWKMRHLVNCVFCFVYLSQWIISAENEQRAMVCMANSHWINEIQNKQTFWYRISFLFDKNSMKRNSIWILHEIKKNRFNSKTEFYFMKSRYCWSSGAIYINGMQITLYITCGKKSISKRMDYIIRQQLNSISLTQSNLC